MATNKSASTGFAALVTRSASVRAAKKASLSSKKHWKPHVYQKWGIKFLVERAAAALLMDPGLGKTSISYAALKVLKSQGMLRGALVVAPRRVAVSTWPQEQQEWEDFKDLKVVVLHGDHKEERVLEKADVYVINYEGLRWLINSGHMRRLLDKKFIDVLIIDELSKIKHTDSGRHKLLAAWHHRFARRWGLTGSPASNGLLDIFGQAYMLDFGAAFGKFVTHFRFNFFYPDNVQSDYPVWLPKPGAEELIYARMKPLALRIEARKHVKMPELVPPIPAKFDLDPKVRKQYDAMEQEFFSVMEDLQKKGKRDLITAATAAAATIKCRQIATGAVYEDLVDPLTGMPRQGGRKWHELHSEKLDALEDLVDELQGQQLLIGFEFGHDKERMLKLLGADSPAIAGGTSDKKALAYELAWNRRGITNLIGHPGSIGHGLNLQKGGAHHIFFYTLGYDYELWDQFVRRLMRQGNPAERLILHIPMARDTIEEAVWDSLRAKRRTQDNFQRALEDYKERKTGR